MKKGIHLSYYSSENIKTVTITNEQTTLVFQDESLVSYDENNGITLTVKGEHVHLTRNEKEALYRLIKKVAKKEKKHEDKETV